jgi:hypothetical protein
MKTLSPSNLWILVVVPFVIPRKRGFAALTKQSSWITTPGRAGS